ncbi:MAG: DUF6249 domain-containing protein [Chthoniobacterales bacterium]
MKITFLKIKLLTYFCCVVALTLTAHGQSPTFTPEATASPTAIPDANMTPASVSAPSLTPAATAIPAATAMPVATLAPAVAPTPDTEEDFDKAIERKIRKHLTIDGDGKHSINEDVPWVVLPIVLIVFVAIFGVPVAIVGLIMYFSFSKSRAVHKTVRMMVEKGQPVPEALLNPPPVVRQRSDLRRGVVLLMVGAGLMVFFGALNDWDGGAWSLGIIPFLIGAGYLLVWKLDVNRGDTSPKV